MFRDEATAVLTAHATYTWNKAGTRIRCNGDSCGVVLEAPDGPDDGIATVAVFARHQAELLPDPFDPDAEPDAPAEPTTEDAVEAEAVAVPAAVPVEPPVHEAAAAEHPETTPETDPAGEHLETALTEPAPKVRRDTKALTATIAEINKGDRVSAGFNHPRYGQFTVEGTVVKGGAGLDRNQLMVGGWYINLNERASKYLHELTIVAPAGQHEYVIPKPSELTEHVGIGG
jgi:hypothetical protein